MNFHRILCFTVIITLVAVSLNCNSGNVNSRVKKESGVKTSNFNHYLPLKEGNKWVYVNEVPGNEAEQYIITISDVKKTERGLQLTASSFPYLTKENTEQTITVNSKNEIELNDYFSATGVFLPSPENMKKGYSWSFGIFNGYVNETGLRVAAETETFDDCIYVLMTDGFTFSFELWYKKDVGIVKWGANRTNPPALNIVYYVVKEYKLN
jgi:hypothetical protein